jgi:transposase
MTYSSDFRSKVLSVRQSEGLSIREVGKRFQIGSATVIRWLKRIEACQSVPRRRKLDKMALEQDVKQSPDAYQYERAARFGVSQAAIGCALRKLGLTYKKNASASQGRRKRTAGFPGKHPDVS